MEKFAFVLHPLVVADFARKFPILNYVPDHWIESAMKRVKAFKISHITGVHSPYAEAEGWFIACPLTAKQMVNLPEEFVLDKITEACQLAESLGAKIVGLGAFSSIVGDAGITVAKRVNIAVTSGNSYTVATALEGTRQAVRMMGKDLANANVAIIGATGSIGAACAKILTQEAKHITLVARAESRLESLAQELFLAQKATITITSSLQEALHDADVVLTVTSALETLIDPKDLKSGAVVCDVARPRNVSKEVSRLRKDVLVIEGGVINVPGSVDFGFNFGFPPRTSYACMAETMILALEGRYENYTLGRQLSVEQIVNINKLAEKHEFSLAGFRNFEKEVTKKEIEEIQHLAGCHSLPIMPRG
ncbi:MAG TPA: NAD(P)H-binding protein [Candidatus Avacidaminococcus intestinavium]|uniref:NAD(P)H-binding protein n=1 Tax=Candidatus Avacidaminococcus intestinavium TaxID=2840684 RepID=A0A9D1MP31_9FIRM|nr:NAD(P)H-binding protein [Candidatus Avacidaminococcus intestinavium]